MASPQKENGYTPIANEILESLAYLRLPGECWSLLMVIFRNTYGYQKKTDWISLNQMMAKTGMGKPNISRAKKKLIARNLIIQSDNKYQFNKDYASWNKSSLRTPTWFGRLWESLFKVETSLSKRIISLSKRITPVVQADNESLSKRRPTKERKKLLQKKVCRTKKSDPRINVLKAYFTEAYMQKFAVPYLMDHGKDGMTFQRMLKTYETVERLKMMIDAFMSTTDNFICGTSKTISILGTNNIANAMAIEASNKRKAEILIAKRNEEGPQEPPSTTINRFG